MVLRRVEHLQQRGRRVAAPVGADLVDLVEQDHRVHRSGVAERAHEPPRQSADVGAAVAADLSLVTYAAERHAHELPVERARDRLADRGLAGSGRPDQRQDRAGALVLGDAALLAELAHREVLDDPLLHVVEPGVVGIEHLARVNGIEPLLGALAPRHREQPVEVRPDHRGLAALFAHPLQPVELALGLLAHGLGHLGFGEAGAVVVGDRRVVLAELLADRLHLLAEDVLALLALCALLDVVADAAAHLKLGEPLALKLHCELQPLDDVDLLQQLDLLLEGDLRRVRGGVGQCAGLADRADEGRNAPVVAAQLEDLLHDGAVVPLELARLRARRLLVRPLVDLDAQPALRDRCVPRRRSPGAGR